MNEYQKTEWVFLHGDCEGCTCLIHEKPTREDPEAFSCTVLDHWEQFSDRCPRLHQFSEAFNDRIRTLKPEYVIEDHWDRFAALCESIIDGSFSEDDVKAGEAIRSLYNDVAWEEADWRMS